MPERSAFLFIIALGAALLSTGCQTVKPASRDLFPFDEQSKLSEEQFAFAEALANFGMGILLDGSSDSEALVNYSRALILEPEALAIYLHAAAYHIKQGSKEDAIAIMEKCCENNPESVTALLYLAQIHQTFNHLDKAEATALRAIELAPEDHRTHSRLSSVFIAKNEYKRAIAVLEDAVKKVEELSPVLRNLGDLHAQQIHTSPPDEASQKLERAIYYYAEAANMPYDALTPTYLHRLGDLYIMNENIPSAITVLKRLLIYLPGDIQIQKKLALCYITIDDKENAILMLEKIVEKESDNVELYYYLADLHLASGDVQKAIKYYSIICDFPNTRPLPHLQLALLYLDKEPEKAIATLLKALRQMPDNMEFLTVLTRAYLITQREPEAFETFNKLDKLAKERDVLITDTQLLLDLGLLAQKNDESNQARKFYQSAIESNPLHMEPHIRLAFLLMQQEQIAEAIEIIERAESLLPMEAAPHYYLGLLYFKADRFEEAVRSYEQTKELARKNPNVTLDSAFYFHYGAALERQKEYEQAEGMFMQSILLDPDNASALNYLAYMWADLNINIDKALEYVTHALDIEPHNGAFIDTLGWIYHMQGKHDLALDHIKNALHFMPNDPTIAEHKGDILKALGREEEALEWWIYSLRLDPTKTDVEAKIRQGGVDPADLPKPPDLTNEKSLNP